jgi:hypothetical protein
MTGLAWFEAPVDLRPVVVLAVRLGWRASVTPLSTWVGGGVSGSWSLLGGMRGDVGVHLRKCWRVV